MYFDNDASEKERFTAAAQYAYGCLLTEEHPDPSYYDINLTIDSAFEMLIEDGAEFNRKKSYSIAQKMCQNYVNNLIEDKEIQS